MNGLKLLFLIIVGPLLLAACATPSDNYCRLYQPIHPTLDEINNKITPQTLREINNNNDIYTVICV
jgi:hypothetical protein